MARAYLSWVEVAALCHAAYSIGLTVFVSGRYLLSRVRVPMLLISISYILLTLFTVRAIGIWGSPYSPWFWVAIAAWVVGDFGLFLYLVFGPPRHPQGGNS